MSNNLLGLILKFNTCVPIPQKVLITMDCKPDITDRKQENQDVELCFEFDVHVKVENDIEWPVQMASNETNQQDRILFGEFGQNYFQTEKPRYNNLVTKEDYHDGITYDSNENYQKDINREEAKQDFQSVISDRFHEKYQNIVTYEDLKAERFQTCMLCRIYFSDSYSLLQHNLIHLKVPLIKQKLFMCEHCPKYCKRKKDLKNHILINHIRRHNPQIPVTKQGHKCLICNKTYTYKHWFSHMKEVHCEAKIECKKCNLLFKNKRNLKRHNMHVHEGVKKYTPQETKCPQCPAILNCKFALTTHLRNCHSKETHTCQICNSTLKCKSYLLAHMKRVHYNDGIIHQCETCGKEFRSERYMKIHIKNSHIKKES